jgi:hypothetical protein
MFPTEFIEVCSLGVQKVIFGVLTKFNFFLQITHNGEHIKNSKKNSQKSYFLMEMKWQGFADIHRTCMSELKC